MAVQAQAHIHLDTDLEGAPENSPTNKYVALTPESVAYKAHIAIEYSVNAVMMSHKVTSAGDPVVSKGRRYRLKLTRAELAALVADLGREVYFVEHYHCDDNEDHTAYRETAQFVGLTDVQSKIHADLSEYYATVELQIS